MLDFSIPTPALAPCVPLQDLSELLMKESDFQHENMEAEKALQRLLT